MGASTVSAGGPYRLPMFPLGQVSFPATLVPLRVFEPRYVQMVRDCLRSDAGDGPSFGVVLIERGQEVGGGDARFGVGVATRIMQVSPESDGSFGVVAVGIRRIRVLQWLPDDPYPQAMVADEPDPVDAPDEEVQATASDLRRLLARCAEAGWPAAPATVELAADPATLLWHLCAVLPVGPLDDHALLAAPDGPARLALLRGLIADVDGLVADRLAGT
jgi:Lon protease-like protein